MKALVELVYTPRSKWNEAEVRAAFATVLSERYGHVKDVSAKRND